MLLKKTYLLFALNALECSLNSFCFHILWMRLNSSLWSTTKLKLNQLNFTLKINLNYLSSLCYSEPFYLKFQSLWPSPFYCVNSMCRFPLWSQSSEWSQYDAYFFVSCFIRIEFLFPLTLLLIDFCRKAWRMVPIDFISTLLLRLTKLRIWFSMGIATKILAL